MEQDAQDAQPTEKLQSSSFLPKFDRRRQRAAKALRRNLLRRKAQVRGERPTDRTTEHMQNKQGEAKS